MSTPEQALAEIVKECTPLIGWPNDGGAVAENVLSIIEGVSAPSTLATVERYCTLSLDSISVPTREMAAEILAIIRGGKS